MSKKFMDEGRRNFLARGLELASAVPLIYLLKENFDASRKYSQADISGALVEDKPNILVQFRDMQKDYDLLLENLVNEYRDEYYRSHTGVYTTTDSKGNIKFNTHTVWDWEEPNNVPDHSVVYSWRDNQDDFFNKIDLLVSQQLLFGDFWFL